MIVSLRTVAGGRGERGGRRLTLSAAMFTVEGCPYADNFFVKVEVRGSGRVD